MAQNELTIVNRIIELTENQQIKWRNFKDFKPNRTLSELDVRRIRSVVKYPKNVLPVRDGYNKYQSYYAFHDDLVLALTKGKRDDLLILIAGEVTSVSNVAGERPNFTRNLSVFTDETTDGLISKLHQLVHGTHHVTQATNNALDILSEKLL